MSPLEPTGLRMAANLRAGLCATWRGHRNGLGGMETPGNLFGVLEEFEELDKKSGTALGFGEGGRIEDAHGAMYRLPSRFWTALNMAMLPHSIRHAKKEAFGIKCTRHVNGT